jgi:hypothetical protein
MALKMNMVSPQGFDVQDAYLRVESVQLAKKDALQFVLRMYKNSQEKLAFDGQQFSCEYVLNGNNPLNQAYNYIKTLPEFSTSTDC